MKKSIILLLILIFITSNAKLIADDNSLNISIDPRIELLAAVQILSDYNQQFGLITRYDFPYKRDVLEYFSLYREHEAVKLFSEMSAKGFSFDAPPAAMLYLSTPPELTQQVPFIDYLKKRAGDGQTLNTFIDALRKFSRETEFITFFKAHRGTFKQITSIVKKTMSEIDYIATLEAYYGMKQHSYNIVLAPLFHPGGFGPRVQQSDGTYDIYNICGSRNTENGFPVFGDVTTFRHLAWHEFSHSFVNPATNKFLGEVNKYQSLFEPIAERMKEQAYSSWATCVNEHIVRAVTTRLMYREVGLDEGDRALQHEKSRGFFYVEALCKALEKYENQPEKFPTFIDFYPELINVFKELSEKDLSPDFYTIPFTGTINGIFSDKKSIILIKPTNENGKTVTEEIQNYVESIRNQFFKNAEIITDAQALKKDLSNNTIVAYGTPKGNLWIGKLMSEMPIKINANHIIADSVYTGDHLRLISVWPNPQNPKKGALIYAAQLAEDIAGINIVFHGPTDYVIAAGKDILKAADYKKSNGQWGLE